MSRPRLAVVRPGDVPIYNLVLVQFEDGEQVAIAGTKQELRDMLTRAGEALDQLE